MSRAAEVEAQAAQWLARRDADGWSAQQQAALDAWIAEATAHRIAYLRLDSVWRRADRLGSLRAPDRAARAGRRFAPPRFSAWRLAAGVALLAGAGWFAAAPQWWVRPDTYATVLGESRAVALADGSHLTLNTDTRLRARVAGGKRTVWLERGEVYFEVAHDASRPFVVEAGASRVTVLGTKFTVRRDGGQVKVTVVDGRVAVSPASGDGPGAAGRDLDANSNAGRGANAGAPAGAAVVTNNDTLVADHGAMRVSRQSSAQVAGELGWRQGKLVFDQMTLAQAAAEFNRYNRRKLVIADAGAAQIRIGGSFNVDNVDGFARLLQQGFGLKVQANQDEIKILR